MASQAMGAPNREQAMQALWRYIQEKDNRERLVVVCGGLAAVVAAGWAAYTHFSKKEAPEKPQTTISAPGGVAAGTITSSPITVTSQPPGAPGASSSAPLPQ